MRALYCGRLSSEKNILILLEAWLQVVAKQPQARLWIVGEGGSYRSEEEKIRAKVAGNQELRRTVVMTGWVNDPLPFYASIDVFVLISKTEGMSNALVEASSSSRVIVASAIPPNASLLGETYPLLWRDSRPESLASLLISAMTQSSFLREAALGHEVVKSPSPTQFGQQVLKALS